MKRQVGRSIKRGPANARSQEAAHRQARVSKLGAGMPQHQQVQMSEPGAGRLRAPLALWGDARGRSQGVSAARLLQDCVSMGGHTAENRAGERRRRREAASKSCDVSMAVARARALLAGRESEQDKSCGTAAHATTQQLAQPLVKSQWRFYSIVRRFMS